MLQSLNIIGGIDIVWNMRSFIGVCRCVGKEKLSVGASEPVRLVLESDGTQVEDGDYWRTLPPNTVLLLLRPGERWYPTGVDVIKAGK